MTRTPAVPVGREAKLWACSSSLSRVALSKADPPERSPEEMASLSRPSSFW
jgi:hypothetical protein